jgi:hypothetical protein
MSGCRGHFGCQGTRSATTPAQAPATTAGPWAISLHVTAYAPLVLWCISFESQQHSAVDRFKTQACLLRVQWVISRALLSTLVAHKPRLMQHVHNAVIPARESAKEYSFPKSMLTVHLDICSHFWDSCKVPMLSESQACHGHLAVPMWHLARYLGASCLLW